MQLNLGSRVACADLIRHQPYPPIATTIFLLNEPKQSMLNIARDLVLTGMLVAFGLLTFLWEMTLKRQLQDFVILATFRT